MQIDIRSVRTIVANAKTIEYKTKFSIELSRSSGDSRDGSTATASKLVGNLKANSFEAEAEEFDAMSDCASAGKTSIRSSRRSKRKPNGTLDGRASSGEGLEVET